ncbi:phage holin family protein [Phycicoccus sonneratiae]|uniref:Phage holin family protein n=1 Tax=Phycicoccus sonneratiae TaxID=2807628 RepID=A0ABS2CG28_9MICO|nr:phage holin family protein [Phycicoccus sonneraticus]MBM6398834.1 phage holin family protein [Phycicoccus sonneraticus]
MAPETSERTIGQLVADATHDLQGIVRGEIALAKAEVAQGAKVIGKGAGMFAGAAFVGLLGLIFLFHTLAYVVAIWLPVWAGYLVVTVFMFLVAGVLALLGKSAFDKAKPAPERAIEQGRETIAALRRDGDGTGD